MEFKEAFERIPQSVKNEAINWKRDCAINYDNDFGDFFVSPFVYRTTTEDGQTTVALVKNGQISPVGDK